VFAAASCNDARKELSPRPQPAVVVARKPSSDVRHVRVRQILCLLPLLLVTVVAVQHRSVLVEGFGQLRARSGPGWWRRPVPPV
jgi:hypothetical protein